MLFNNFSVPGNSKPNSGFFVEALLDHSYHHRVIDADHSNSRSKKKDSFNSVQVKKVIVKQQQVNQETSNNENIQDDRDIVREENKLSSLFVDFKTIDPKTDIFKKYRKLEQLFEKSEKLRILMKKRHKQKYMSYRQKIKQLQKKLKTAQVG